MPTRKRRERHAGWWIEGIYGPGATVLPPPFSPVGFESISERNALKTDSIGPDIHLIFRIRRRLLRHLRPIIGLVVVST